MVSIAIAYEFIANGTALIERLQAMPLVNVKDEKIAKPAKLLFCCYRQGYNKSNQPASNDLSGHL
jgi:hypothetical protein